MASLAHYESRLRQAITAVSETFRQGISQGIFIDAAHLGSTGEAYPWAPALLVDVDLWLLSEELDERVGNWLLETSKQLQQLLTTWGLSFQSRAIDGPYKPVRQPGSPPIIFAHLLLDTKLTYERRCVLTRWCWRKYRCIRVPNRLATMAPVQPRIEDLLNVKWGILKAIHQLRKGRVSMPERMLPRCDVVSVSFSKTEPEFVEFCFSAVTHLARSHARVLGFLEPDTLPNKAFFSWYSSKLFESEEMKEVLRVKQDVRVNGMTADPSELCALALASLENLQVRVANSRS